MNQWLSFKVAADQGSFAKTARMLNLTAAAVGKQIKSLEDDIGAQLFYRTTRQIMLTELGEALYKQCDYILQEVEKAEDLIAAYQGVAIGRLKVMSSVYFGEYLIAPYLTEFMATYPGVTIEFELADRVPDIATENIDALFGLMSGLPSHYMQRRITSDYYVFCASPAYIKQYGAPEKPENMLDHCYITHSNRPDPAQLKTSKGEVIVVKPRFWTNNTNVMLQSCIDGMGITMLHAGVAMEAIKEGKLVEILQSYRQPKQPLYVYFKKAHYMQPKLRVFIDYILDKIGQSSSAGKF